MRQELLQLWCSGALRLMLAVCLSCVGTSALADNRLRHAEGWLHVGGVDGVHASIAVLPDPREALEWEQVRGGAGFVRLAPGERPVFGSTGTWFRIDLSIPVHLLGETAWLRVVPALIWRLEWHDERGRSGLAGMSELLSGQDYPASPSAIRVPLDGPQIRLFLRVQTAAPQLTHLSLLSEAAFQDEQQRDTRVQALFLGAAGLMLLLTLLNWVYVRSSLYRAFALYLAATTVFALCVNGQIRTHLLPDEPVWMARLCFASFMWAIAATILFSLSALSIPQRLPRLAGPLKGLAAVIVLGSALGWEGTLIAPVSAVMWPFHLALGLVFLVLSLQQALYWKTAQSWVVCLAYLSFNVFEKFPLMSMLGWFPVHAWTTDVAKMGLLCQMLLTQLQWSMRMREQQSLERRALAADLEAKAERSQRRDLLQFLAMFGHEVRTPLAIIHAATESLEMLPGADLPANRSRHHRIRAAVERLSVLSREALSRERIEASGWRPRCRPVQLPQLVEELLWQQQVDSPEPPHRPHTNRLRLPLRVAGQPGGWLCVQWAQDLPPIQADPDMLQVAMGNLLDNARKYADPGSEVRLELWCSGAAYQPLQRCFIDMSSQGVELSEAERSRIFDKYWRRDENRNIPGAGMGLYLVRTIVEAHGGHVDAQSLPERWTRFRIMLPCQGPVTDVSEKPL